MMQFELGLEQLGPRRVWQSALTIACSCAVSGLIPLSPYIFIPDIHTSLSVAVTILALFIFGYVITGVRAFHSAWQTALIGGAAVGAAFGLEKLLG